MKQEKITNTFLQAFVGGKFESEKQYLARMPVFHKGKIKGISIESGVVTIFRFRNKEMEIVLSTCDITSLHLGKKIVFDSFFDGHYVTIRVPKR